MGKYIELWETHQLEKKYRELWERWICEVLQKIVDNRIVKNNRELWNTE